MKKEQPINNIVWIEAKLLTANGWNPNFVLSKELQLLKLSLLSQGWIQPVLVDQNNVIIDGWHRSFLCKNDKDVAEMTDGKCPCAVLDLTEPERMLLTVRINRAKGVHSAVKMHELVSILYTTHKLTVQQIGDGIGANKDEVDLLLKENVFKKLDIENTPYSEAWAIRESTPTELVELKKK